MKVGAVEWWGALGWEREVAGSDFGDGFIADSDICLETTVLLTLPLDIDCVQGRVCLDLSKPRHFSTYHTRH